MVSVRCMRGSLPGGKSMTANRLPLAGGAVPMMRAPRSSTFSPMAMSAGVRSVDQIRVETVPALGCLALVAGPCMMTLATPRASWPVTKRGIGGWLGFSLTICAPRCVPGSSSSIELRSDRLDQRGPVLGVVFNQLGKLRGRQIDALEAVGLEELARLRQVQNLADIVVNLLDQIRRHVRRPPQREPGGGRE